MAASVTVPAFNISFFAFHRPLSPSFPTTKLIFYHPIFRSPCRDNSVGVLSCPQAAISRQAQGKDTFDPELRSVLELATDSELYEIERILFGPSYFSPLLKSITKQADVDYPMIKEDPEERDAFIEILESRFLFLAADARSTLSEESGTFPSTWASSKSSNGHGSLELGLSQWKVQALAALRVGAEEFRSIILKGGGMFTLGKMYHLLARRLSGKMFLEAANYQIKKEAVRKNLTILDMIL